uniref:NB-ARC domain-containing protein n=2 Tax=Gossypium TaxID=3633 RepID=A0A0D2UHF3_GOSRA|nr:hypothetical protein B456_010G226800 [Gossypium raimondii]
MNNCFSVGVALENFIIRSWGSIIGHANYVCKLKQTLPTLTEALQDLRAQRDDVQRMRLERVQLRLSKAETMITEAEKLVANGPQQMNNLCLGGFASKNCLSTYKFGKKVAKMLQAINDLISKGVFDKVAESQPAASVVVRPEERPIALQPTIEKVWNCIVDKDVGIIGLYGLGGVGKTTLLTQINNKFSTTPNGFDVVIWALVSNGYDIGKIQNKIGGNIGFSAESWKNKSVEEKAVDIYGVLRIKRFVVLLDDFQDNGSKLICTTRCLEVCGEMEAREKIKVEYLEPKEAWKLFQDKVGDETLNSHPDIRKLAKQVDERCGGLPLALITIGRAFQQHVEAQCVLYCCKPKWQNEGKQLYSGTVCARRNKLSTKVVKEEKTPFGEQIFGTKDWDSQVCKSDLLFVNEAKVENELCSNSAMACKTTPGDWKYAIEMVKRCTSIYDNLSNVTMKCFLLYCCLYPEDYCIPRKRLVEYWFCEEMLNEFDRISEAEMDGEDFVKMHDVIRDMVLWIVCELEAKENNFFVKAGAQLFEEPDVKIWECAKRMSVMKNNIEENKLKVINDGFLQFIPHLTVLNLSNNSPLQVLPKGISQLISLECLDLSHTAIRELPIELKSLRKLKMSDLSCIPYLRRIPRHLISKEDNVLNGGNENLIEELKRVQHLNILSMLPFTSMFALERFLSFNLFRCCTQELRLSGFKESNVFNVLCLENVECLQTLNLRNCENVEEIKMEKLHTWVSPGTSYTSPFHTLTSVSFQDCHKLTDVTWLILVPNLSLWKLKSVYWDVLPFPCLKCIFVGICPELKKLPLNSDSAKGNRITIDGNEDWWAEIEWENEATRQTFLPFFRSYS